MALNMAELLNYVLKLDEGDRQQASLDLQVQQAHQGNVTQYLGILGQVKDPHQLGAVQQQFANAGVPLATLQNLSDQYLPEVSHVQRAMVQQGMAENPQDQPDLRRTVMNNVLTGSGAGTNATEAATAREMGSPMFSPEAQRGHLFSRIGFNPGALAASDATAAAIGRNTQLAGNIGAGFTGYQQQQEDFGLRKAMFGNQAEMANRQFNRGIYEADRGYAIQSSDAGLRTGEFMDNRAYKQAEIEALKRKAAKGDLDAIKELNNALQMFQKGGMAPETVDILKGTTNILGQMAGVQFNPDGTVKVPKNMQGRMQEGNFWTGSQNR